MSASSSRVALLGASCLLFLNCETVVAGTTSAIDAPPGQVCASNPDAPEKWIVRQNLLANWLDQANHLMISATARAKKGPQYDPLEVLSWDTSSKPDSDRQEQFVDDILLLGKPLDKDQKDSEIGALSDARVSIDTLGATQKNSKNPFYGEGGKFDNFAWLRQTPWQKPLRIVCDPDFRKPLPPSPGLWTNLRVRGKPDTLAIARTDAAPAGAPPNNGGTFDSVDSATISYADDGTKKSKTSILQATVGYAFDFAAGTDSDFVVVPYGAINRNLTDTSGSAPVTTTNFYDFGVVLGWSYYTSDNWTNVFSVRPHYLANDMDGSRQVGLHFEEVPIVSDHAINDYWVSGLDKTSLAFAFLFDLRGDVDTFATRGATPATNTDYFRLGSRFGGTASWNQMQVKVTDTWMYGVTGALDSLNDFQASWSYNFDPDKKYFAFSVSYKKGTIEDTGQPEQIWMVALTGKY